MGGRRIALISAVVVLGSLVVVPLARAAAPSNDNVADAAVVDTLAFDAEVDLSEATVEAGEPDCYSWAYAEPPAPSAGAPAAASLRPNPSALGLKASHEQPSQYTTNTVWYSFEPTADIRVVVDTLGSAAGQDTVLAVYEDSKWGTYTVACNDDNGGSLSSRVVFNAYAGQRYLIQLGAFQGAATSAHLHIDVAPPPGVISGTVTDDATGEPIGDVCVEVYGDGGYGWDITDPDGTYSAAVDAGDVRVAFYDCRWDADGSYYGFEYYDDVQDYENAVVLTVESGGAIPGVDAGLALTTGNPWGGSDLAITSMDIEHAVLQVDGAVAPVGPGTLRTVRVDVANLGTSSGAGYVGVSVCPMSTPNYCSYLEPQHVEIDASGTQALAFNWSGIGTVGDVTVTAFVDTCGGYGEDWNNNEMSRRDYVTVGGTGVGVGTGNWTLRGSSDGCYYYSGGSTSAQP